MKKIYIRQSSLTEDDGFNNTQYTFYVQFKGEGAYAYTIKATADGFGHTTELWEQAGYEIVYKKD